MFIILNSRTFYLNKCPWVVFCMNINCAYYGKNKINGFDVEQLLIPIWNEFIYSGHLFALGAISVVAMCAIIFSIPITWDFLALIYFIFYPIYFYDYSRGASDDLLTNSKRAEHFKNKKKTSFIIYGSFLITGIISLYFSNFLTMCISFTILIFGLLYGSYFKLLTKKIVAFKNIYVSFVWALLVIFLFYYYSFPLTSAALLITTFIFLRIFIIQILFDVRDVEGDQKKGLKTVPVVLGNHKEFNLLKNLNGVTILMICYGIYFNLIPIISFVILLAILYSFYYIQKIRACKKDHSCYLLAAVEPTLCFALIFCSNYFFSTFSAI